MKAMPGKEIYIVIPALNKGETISMVIQEIFRENIGGRGLEVEIVVIDNHSSDRTKKIAKDKGDKAL